MLINKGVRIMKKILLILCLSASFQSVHGLAAVGMVAAGAGIEVAKEVGTSYCIPFLRWCTGSIHDVLTQEDQKELMRKKETSEHGPTYVNCNINIIQNPEVHDIEHSFPASHHRKDLTFHDELTMLERKRVEIFSIPLTSTINTLAFEDDDYTLEIKGAIKKSNSKEFDFLFAHNAISHFEKDEREYFHGVIHTLNYAAKVGNNPEEGLFVTRSGRKVYKFGATYFLPLTHDEEEDLHVIHKVCKKNQFVNELEEHAEHLAQMDLHDLIYGDEHRSGSPVGVDDIQIWDTRK